MPSLRIIASPTERTTAATDALLAAQALLVVATLSQMPAVHPWKAWLWIINFGLLALAAALGAVVHGLELPHRLLQGLWGMVYLLLGQVVGLFTVAAIFDLWGQPAAQNALLPLVGIGLLFFAMMVARSSTFFMFIIFQAVALLFALLVYLWLTLSGGLPGAGWMAAGIVTTLAAAAVQAGGRARFTLVWQFDHNGTYHFLMMAAVALLFIGLAGGGL
jgi:hypothetical protein